LALPESVEETMDAMVCPKGHSSTESDYCSECGAKIAASTPAAAAAPAPAPGPEAGPVAAVATATGSCPSCGAPRDDSGVAFCEVCGRDFASAPAVVSPENAAPRAQISSWMVTISVDPALREPESPEPPVGIAPATIELKEPASLIGRRSEARAIFPEINIPHDDAISHRHALLQVYASGTLLLRDIGSSNGTRLNGKTVEQMVDHPLTDGDTIALGHWSRIDVKAIY
jgi:hypothetical protein